MILRRSGEALKHVIPYHDKSGHSAETVEKFIARAALSEWTEVVFDIVQY